MTDYLYRVLATDEDGDPLDVGILTLRGRTPPERPIVLINAVGSILRRRLRTLGSFGGEAFATDTDVVSVRVYPMRRVDYGLWRDRDRHPFFHVEFCRHCGCNLSAFRPHAPPCPVREAEQHEAMSYGLRCAECGRWETACVCP